MNFYILVAKLKGEIKKDLFIIASKHKTFINNYNKRNINSLCRGLQNTAEKNKRRPKEINVLNQETTYF